MTSPVEGGWKGSERESWGEETTAVKRKREAELEVLSAERRGKGSVMPTLDERVEGTAVVSISCL